MKFIVGTASNSHFFIHLQQMLHSLHHNIPDDSIIIIQDNGLKEAQKKCLLDNYGFFRYVFMKKDLTPWERDSYIFKLDVLDLALNQLRKECDVYLWMDSRNVLKHDVEQIKKDLAICPVWGTTPFNQAEHLWTDKRTLDAMEIKEEDRNTIQIQASGYMIDFQNPLGIEFATELIEYSRDESIITPEGTTKGQQPPTHRQDQSVFSCLMKKKGFKNMLEEDNKWVVNHNTLHFI